MICGCLIFLQRKRRADLKKKLELLEKIEKVEKVKVGIT